MENTNTAFGSMQFGFESQDKSVGLHATQYLYKENTKFHFLYCNATETKHRIKQISVFFKFQRNLCQTEYLKLSEKMVNLLIVFS